MSLQEVRYGKKLKRVSLQRYLVSKIIYEKERISDQDLLVLFDNQVWLEQKVLRDKDFQKKFGRELGVLSKNLKEMNLTSGLNVKTLTRLSSKLKTEIDDFIVPRRNYSDYKQRFSSLFTVITAQQPGVLKSKLPPKQFIGKGYGDKGTLKNLARDGSPPWQEIASHGGQMKLIDRRIKDAKNIEEIIKVLREAFVSEG